MLMAQRVCGGARSSTTPPTRARAARKDGLLARTPVHYVTKHLQQAQRLRGLKPTGFVRAWRSVSGRGLHLVKTSRMFWAKARDGARFVVPFHPLPFHNLDVAAVGERLIEGERLRLSRLARAIGVDATLLARVAPFLLSLHDLGKFSRVFQAKAPEHWPTEVLGPYRAPPAGSHHSDTGQALICDLIRNGPDQSPEVHAVFDAVFPRSLGWRAADIEALLAPIMSHHGRPPRLIDRLATEDICPACRAAAIEHISAMADLFEPPALPRLRGQRERNVLA